MKDSIEKQLLKNPDEIPSEELFDEILSKEQLQIYDERIEPFFGLTVQFVVGPLKWDLFQNSHTNQFHLE